MCFCLFAFEDKFFAKNKFSASNATLCFVHFLPKCFDIEKIWTYEYKIVPECQPGDLWTICMRLSRLSSFHFIL